VTLWIFVYCIGIGVQAGGDHSAVLLTGGTCLYTVQELVCSRRRSECSPVDRRHLFASLAGLLL
jgi:hypothetical protein